MKRTGWTRLGACPVFNILWSDCEAIRLISVQSFDRFPGIPTSLRAPAECVGEGGGMAALSCQEGFGQASHETPAYAPYYIPGQKITRISVRTEKGTTKYSGKLGLKEMRAGVKPAISLIFQ